MNDSPIVLPSNVMRVRAAREGLLKRHEWKVCWRHAHPRRVEVIHVVRPCPDWAEEEWSPPYHDNSEEIACRAVLRTLVSKGFEAEMVDDAMGEAIESWADHPSRVMEHGLAKNQLMSAYNAVSAHLANGGRFRDIPIHTCEMVCQELGAELWAPHLVRELSEFGPFPQRYHDLIEDLWTRIGEDQLGRITERLKQQRKGSIQ